MPNDLNAKSATLFRMVMTDHMCPFGLKSKDLLERQGYRVDDQHLTTREAVDAFKAKHDVKTTPQTFIDGKRVGGDSKVPLGFVSLTENLMMMGMSLWMLSRLF